jgi:hypothetical protein
MRAARSKQCCVLLWVCLFAGAAPGEPIKVLRPQGSAHGFVEVTTLDGSRIAVGDLVQRLSGSVVTSHLVLKFLDGSLDDETTVYSERGVFRFISDHHIQRGPSFPTPIDVTVDAAKGLVSSTDPGGHTTQVHLAMPPDVYNGLATGILMNLAPLKTETVISIVAAADTPRIVHLSMKSVGEVPFTIGGTPRTATDYVVHVEIGGVAGVVAPIVGKQPLDYHVWILAGDAPAFIREEGALYVGGPVWRIQQISATFTK